MKIGIALSGGGILGIAHIKVLEELEKNNIKLDMICGTSAGAIVGALYSSGGVDAVNNFVNDLQSSNLSKSNQLSLVLSNRIYSKIRAILEKNLKTDKFEDLQINFSCVATDVIEGKPVVLRSGNLIDSVMASISFPGFFPLQSIDGRYLTDGGLVTNMPAEILRNLGADFVIGSLLSSLGKVKINKKNGTPKLSRFGMMKRATDILKRRLSERDISHCDFCFYPNVDEFRWFHFSKMDAIKNISDEHVKESMPKLKTMLEAK